MNLKVICRIRGIKDQKNFQGKSCNHNNDGIGSGFHFSWYYFFSVIAIVFVLMLAANLAHGLTASEFAAKYGDQFSKGEKITVLISVKGEPESTEPVKRAKEIRYLQSGILKFIHFAGATNVVSDTKENQITATMTTSLAEHITMRHDVLSVIVISATEEINSVQQADSSEFITLKIPDWVRKNAKWWSLTQISDKDFSSGLEYLMRQKIIQIPDTIPPERGDYEKKLPGWLRKDAGWWSQKLLSDEEFAKSLKWMVVNKFIKI
jgi:hypothetical protein